MYNISLMSFNIRGSFDTWDVVNSWNKRAALNVATIKLQAPDLIGFQELQSGNLETFRNQLSEYSYFLGPEGGNHEPHDYNPIFWNHSRLEMVDSGGFWISKTPDVHSADWDTASIRAATWVKLKTLNTKEEFLHFNTHLDHVSETARTEGSKLILKQIHGIGGNILPVIITGDFNSIQESPAYRSFIENGFIDAYLTAGHQESAEAFTFHNFEGEQYSAERHGYPLSRIDWVLTRDSAGKMQTKSCDFIRDNKHPLYPSDHYPVLAELMLK